MVLRRAWERTDIPGSTRAFPDTSTAKGARPFFSRANLMQRSISPCFDVPARPRHRKL